MSTRGQHRAGAAVVAGLALLALGAAAPAQADQPNPGTAPATKPASKPEPKPAQDLTPPARPALGEASMAAGGTISLGVQAEQGSALVVREGDKVVASASAVGATQTLTWRSGTGPHTFLVVATDAAGNVSEGAPVTLDVDATPPSAEKFTVTSGTARDSRSRWSVVTDAGTAYTLSVDGKPVEEGTAKGRTIKGYLDLVDGRHEVSVELRDEIGNVRAAGSTVNVDIPTLWVAAKAISGPSDTDQVFKVAAPPNTRGYLRIPGVGGKHFELTDGRAEVTMEVPEGDYDAPVVIVADSVKRHGTVELAPFAVDSTAPALEVTTSDGAAERGLLSATVTAGAGDTVTWRVLTDSGFAVLSGEFIADGTDQVLERELGEGSYTLEVTATDGNGNATVEKASSSIAARPLINPDVVPALVITLVLWVLVGTAIYLRRRARRLRKMADRIVGERKGRRLGRAAQAAEHAKAVAEYEQQVVEFQAEDEAWEQRRADLAQLVAVARGAEADLTGVEVELVAEERAYCALPASLVEMADHDGAEAPVVVDHGQLVVTDARVIFVGREQRDWEFAEMRGIRHLDHDLTVMTVANRETVSGVAYDDADLVRLYLELAMAELDGSTRSVLMMLEQGLRQHELRRPQAPAPVGPAPTSRRGRGARKSGDQPVPSQPVPSQPAADEGLAEKSPAPALMVQQAAPVDQPTERSLVLSKN